jgi:hypothetical protein
MRIEVRIAGSPAENRVLRFVEMQEGAVVIDRAIRRNDVRECRRGRDTAMVFGPISTLSRTGVLIQVP